MSAISRSTIWMLGVALLCLIALLIIAGYRSRMADHPGARMAAAPSTGTIVHVLTVADPFANKLDSAINHVEAIVGAPVRLHLRRYARTLEEILLNHRDQTSFYDLVSFDVLWLPRLAREGILLPLRDEQWAALGRTEDEFYPLTLELNRHNGVLYGLPIQPHLELLWYRTDLLSEAGFAEPSSLAELLEQARYFHRPEQRMYGISWNALRGQALGQTVAHLYAAFGSSVLDADLHPQVNSPAGEQVLQFLLQLMQVSPPDILTMAWDQRIDRFSRGQSAFTYGWTGRAGFAENDPLSAVRGKVGYMAPPGFREGFTAVPFGQWSLGIPTNVTENSRSKALGALAAFADEPIYRLLAADGVLGFHRKGLAQEPLSASLAAVREILDHGGISLAARPSVDWWPEMAEVLGTVFHDVLLGRLEIADALMSAQRQLERLAAAGVDMESR